MRWYEKYLNIKVKRMMDVYFAYYTYFDIHMYVLIILAYFNNMWLLNATKNRLYSIFVNRCVSLVWARDLQYLHCSIVYALTHDSTVE